MKNKLCLVIAPCIIFMSMFSSCTTGNGVNWEEATNAVIFIDLVLTKLENHGLDLEIIYEYVVQTIAEEKEEDPKITVDEVVDLIINRLFEKAVENEELQEHILNNKELNYVGPF